MPSPNNKGSDQGSYSNRRLLWRYSGTAFKFLVVMGLLLIVGYQTDVWFSTGFPIMVWLLPLLGVIGLVLKAYQDTSRK